MPTIRFRLNGSVTSPSATPSGGYGCGCAERQAGIPGELKVDGLVDVAPLADSSDHERLHHVGVAGREGPFEIGHHVLAPDREGALVAQNQLSLACCGK